VTSGANISGVVAGERIEDFSLGLNDNEVSDSEGASDIRTIEDCTCTWRLHCGNSTVSTQLFSVVASSSTPEADPEELSREIF
jgi:hypothetical protein